MRVLFWSDKFAPLIGGTEKNAAILLDALQARGHEFTIIAPREPSTMPEFSLWHGIPLYRFPFRETLNAADLEGWANILTNITELKRAFKPDLIHVYCFGPSTFAHLQTQRASDAPLLVRLNWFEDMPDRAFALDSALARTLAAAARITTVSQATLDLMLPYLPDVASRALVLYNGAPEPPILPEPLPETPTLLCLSRHVHEKGLDVAVDAFARLHPHFPDAKLLIAGDGEERARLEHQVATLGLQTHVEFLGWQPMHQTAQLINRASIVLMPSRHESFGNVAMEAAQMARPVVASRVEGLVEIVDHGVTGFLVEPDNPDALADALAELINHPQAALEMGQAARKRAFERFGIERFTREYDELYQRLGSPSTNF